MKVAVASGKGGTGKTLISTNLFHVIQQLGDPVELIDCDAEEPNTRQFIKGKVNDEEMVTQRIPVIDKASCTFCGKCQEYCQYNAIIVLPNIQHVQVIEELCHDCGACTYACQAGAISERVKSIGSITSYETELGGFLTESQIDIGIYSPVPVIQKAIHSAAENAFVIMDSPPGTSCPFIATVSEADFVVLVTEPTPFGLNDLKLSVNVLKELQKPFGVIVNRAGLGDDKLYHYLDANNIELLADIPFDRQVAHTYSSGNLITDQSSKYKELFLHLYDTLKKQEQHD
ncbi:P-loop NTPase [Sunxiuqinia elliptica]|uniref:MinD superfamily P-loop ATPase n=1 Tax=Sunxiuqinia elliptica TaxID=655355 RepID=A0A4R6H596_9BACT|nr:ATP-binding protein [Sunxiuqinia elliptica]TDO03423.1 MinD superfamily P-loop ATPase [Sunxiuqinia elliptica]TDO59619.1 MinD superfamily P-loop ATPase [Sunxiuqinia elliptica]